MRLGRHQLSDSELLAILLKTGTQSSTAIDIAKNILKHFQGDLKEVGKAQIDDLSKFHGVGQVKSITILAAMELGRRRQLSQKQSKEPIINSSRSCYDVLGPQLADLPHEEFWIIFLNRANRVMGKECVSRGGVSGTLVDTKIIFRKALGMSASGMVLMHNHPSANPNPSEMDIRLTKKIVQAAKLLDILIWDHLIICGNDYTSFVDRGLMPT